jgi:hypothetical protein
MNHNGLGNLDDLFQSAQDDGLTDDTLNLVIANLNGPAVMQAVHTPLNQLTTNEVTLAMNIIDMSGSMSSHAANLIRAYNNDYLAAMTLSAAADDILVSTILFDSHVNTLHGYLPLDDAPRLNDKNYTPDSTTALYDAIAAGMTNMVLYAQQLRQSGVAVRGLVMVYSDGEDNASKQQAQDVRRAAEDLLKQEIYTLVFVGFGFKKQMGFVGSNGRSPVQQLADQIGFPIALEAGLNQSELQRIFHMASVSTIQVSQMGNMAPFTAVS